MGKTQTKPEATPENTEDQKSVADTALNEGGKDYEDRLKKLEDLLLKQNEALEAREKELQEMKEALSQQKKPETLPTEVIENEERMREKVKVFVTVNPLDPKSSHVPVLDPITNKVVQVKRGEEVEVSRAVYEILQNSMKSDKNTALIATELSDKFQKETENL